MGFSYILHVTILFALSKLLIETHKPLLCAGIYSAMYALLGLLFGQTLIGLLLGSGITFGLAFVYYYLLDRFHDTGLFWPIFITGMLIGLV